ncbi:prepilin peptidase [Amantichitinum ursilacus]|uniref:Prepilin leader peptidase/N-methyltransferase n=1 Tax=Amantichitinum ursilacus TaxID=857265 RepID=A0A0N0XI11_9NEIS|nr:A24 family peptidase [Amantichitinum ursilacus]KPC49227.1 Type 4 prepilin-like proteins leader peptide-processing enzyme [Amantichitinum ursilacus]
MNQLVFVFQQSPLVFSGFLLVLGLLVGSFLNVVIHRLPIMIERQYRQECAELDRPDDFVEPMPPRPRYNLVLPRSGCPHCGHMITELENIPLFSWLALRGKCSECRAPISVRYPLVELITGLMTAVVGWHFGFGMTAAGGVVLTWALIALFFIDADTFLLPDSITLPLVWLGLLFNLDGHFVPLTSAVLGAVVGYLMLWSVNHVYRLVRGHDGMGYGDFKLLAALGAWFGWQSIPAIVLFASVAGVIIGGYTLWARYRGFGREFPFGPYLAVAGWLTLLWGNRVQDFIFGLS